MMGASKDRLFLKRLGASLVAILGLTAMSAVASNDVPHEEKGYQKTSYGLSEFESINLASGNLTFRVPLHTLKTDGGLEYPVTAYFNSKFWNTRHYCNLSGDGYGGCQENNGEFMRADIADGIEAFGFGWDLRPPRILFSEDSLHSEFLRVFIDPSGATHKIHTSPPWDVATRSAEGTEYVEGNNFYTGDGTNYRFTVESVDAGKATSIRMENGHGVVYIFSQIVPEDCDADFSQLSFSDDDLSAYNFHHEVSGLYLSEIQCGPWSSGGEPANRITFTYRGSADGWAPQACGGTGNEQYLPVTATAHGEVDRILTFNYSGATLDSLSVPTFNPLLGASNTTFATIDWTTTAKTFKQVNGTGDDFISFSAQHLEVITFLGPVDPPEFSFDDGISGDFLPLQTVTLPSGATVEYTRELAYPVGKKVFVPSGSGGGGGFGGGGKDRDQGQEFVCGAEVPVPPPVPPGTGNREGSMSTFGITKRTIAFHDASSDATPRKETTLFSQGLACPGVPYLDFPSGLPGENQWPYDFELALRDDDSLNRPRPEYPKDTGYLWTVVSTQQGDGAQTAETPLGFSYKAATVEIHRFHPLTREEFSSDIVTGVDAHLLHASANSGFRELFLITNDLDIRVLRHTEIERSVLPGHDDIKDLGVGGGDRYTYISRQATFTDERALSTAANIKGDDPCYPNFTPDDPPPSEILCTEVKTLSTVDQYLNPASSHTESIDSALDPEVDRFNEYSFYTTNPDDPNHPEAAYVWSLDRQVSSRTYDDNDTNPTTTVIRTWTNRSGPGTGIQHYYAVQNEILNPDENGACMADSGDCIQHSYDYDTLGNLKTDTLSGGYGTAGFDTLITTTETTYNHGVAQKKKLNSGSGSLLLWERDIDPNTGLPRWHIDGSGIGFAYLWDALGRPTDIAPVRGSWAGGAQPESLWTLYHQKTGPHGETPMIGVHLDYLSPTGNSLLEHQVYDAMWSADPIGDSLGAGTTGTLRAKALFDGLGRLTRETESYPEGTRSRYHLRFVHDPNGDFEQCDGDYLSWDIPDKSQVTLNSEWVHGETFPVDCDLPWTESQLDALGRPAAHRLPDGSLTTMAFVGNTTTTTTRAIVTTIDASGNAGTTDLSAVAISDALGRLRRIDEEVTTNSFFRTDYAYDQSDRLTKVELFEPGATPTYSQDRTWTYSDAGFLTNSKEPEREIAFSGHNAAGNVTEQSRVGSMVTHTHDYDSYGRFKKTEEDGQALIEQSWSTATIGQPSYNHIIESTRHNLFGASDVAVTHHWTYNGPGGRINARTTEATGLGATGDAFQISYAYDVWGTRSETDLPTWNGCRHSAIETTTNNFDGSWAESLGIIDTLGSTEILGEATYHQTGRIHELTYGTRTTPQVVWREVPDDDGMARPEAIEVSGGHPFLGAYGNVPVFSYDPAGNLWRVGGKRYFYDGLNRLLGEWENQAGRAFGPSQEFDYDRWGNATTVKSFDIGGTVQTQLTFVTDKANGVPISNRIDTVDDAQSKSTVSLTWDGRGNLEHQPAIGPLREKEFDWSEDDRLKESVDVGGGASTTWRYAYDAAGERVLKWHDAGTGVEATAYVRDEVGKTVSEWRNIPGTDDFGLVADYLFLGARQIAELSHQTAPDRVHFIAPDHLGSPKVLFDDDGYLVDWMTFEPFGALKDSGGAVPGTSHLFTGHERDLGTASSELDYMHQRYYSAGLARFVSVDSLLGNTASSQSFNRYSYVINNPMKLVDPDGRATKVFWVSGPGIDHTYLSLYTSRGEITLSVKGQYPGADVTLGDGTVGYRTALSYVKTGHTVGVFDYSLTAEQESRIFDYLQNLPHGGISLYHPKGFVNESFPICTDHVSRAFSAASVEIASGHPTFMAFDLLNDQNATVEAILKPGEDSEGVLGGLISVIHSSDPLQVVNSEVVRKNGVLRFWIPQ